MTILVKQVDFDTYIKTQQRYDSSNFMQSGQLAKIQVARGNFKKTECVIFLKNDEIVGQALINYSPYMKVFTSALISNGPLLDYTDPELVSTVFSALEQYLKRQKVAIVKIHPYIINDSYNEDLECLASNLVMPAIASIEKLGYFRTVTRNENTTTLGQRFYKPLQHFANSKQIYENFSNVLKRDLKKSIEACVKTRELAIEEFDVFYRILQVTGERKGFTPLDRDFLYRLKENFKDAIQLQLAYLDAPAYECYLKENIVKFEEKLAQLKAQVPTKKTKGYINDALDQLRSYEKRFETFQKQRGEEKDIPLSSYMYILEKSEIICFAGGSYEEWINFGGASLLNWQMIQLAKESGRDFNFYGTIETEEAKQNSGNFNYKRQFGGELQVLAGSFHKTYHPVLKWIQKVKRS